ncbi:hypothetical protein KP509_25G017200 [Ceratopteris richardii]|nr:hypothetical protein KP509_25G017200 [Ceratopteris richardii]
MYAKCGILTQAEEVFDQLIIRDVVSWNALVAGYAQHGHCEKAMDSFHQMQQEGFSPDEVTFSCILKACASLRKVQRGKELHAKIVGTVSMVNNTVLGNALLDMYAKCGSLQKAQQVFDELPAQDVVSWNALIAGYCQHEHTQEALESFEQMKGEGFFPDVMTLGCLLKVCGSLGAKEKGKQIHAEICINGFLMKGTVLGNALIDMYTKCGDMAKAEQVLCNLPVRNIVSWNTLIAGYCLHGHPKEALTCFEHMKKEGLSPDKVTFGLVLKACGSIGSSDHGIIVHAEIARRQLLKMGIIHGNALVDMYAKCDELAKAQEVFDGLPFRDAISWTALIDGYSQHGQGEQALKCFEHMKSEGLSPDRVTFSCALKACGSIGAVDKGKDLHSEIARKGLLGKDTMLGGALVDMYCSCGALEMAREVFEELPFCNVITYSALIAGFCEHGYGEEALDYFEEMVGKDLIPDVVTFGCVLKACGSIGDVEKGQKHFDAMTTKYGINPSPEHYTCMVDIFGRAGDLEKAMATIRKMPSSDHLPAWFALMGACKKWGDVKLGKEAFENVVQIDEKATAAYLFMRDIYAAAGMQEDARMIESLGLAKGKQNFASFEEDYELII